MSYLEGFIKIGIAAFFFASLIFLRMHRLLTLFIFFGLGAVYLALPEWGQVLNFIYQFRWVLLVLAVFVCWAEVFFQRLHYSPPPKPLIFFMGFIVLAASSVFYSTHFILSLLKVFSVLLLWLLIYLWGVFNRRDLNIGVQSFYNQLFFLFLMIISSFLVYLGIGGDDNFYFGRQFFKSYFGNPNSVGALIGIFIIPVFASKVLMAKDSGKKSIALLCFVFAIFFLFWSFSRAGILAGLISGIVLVLFLLPRRIFVFYLLLFILFLGFERQIKHQYFEYFYSQWVQKGRATETDIFSSRRTIWENAFDVAKERLWSGYGFGANEDISQSAEIGYHSFELRRRTENSYLTVFEQLGIPGLIVLLLIMISLCNPIPILFLKKIVSRDRYIIIVMLYSIIIGGFVNAIFEDWLFSVGSFICVLFWIIAGMFSWITSDLKNREKNDFS